MTGQEVERRTPVQELVRTVRGEVFMEQVAAALPEGMRPQNFVRVLVTALMEQPELAEEASHESIIKSSIKAATDGLVPDGREAALVMFRPKGARKKAAQYLPMVGGYRKIAAEHGWPGRCTSTTTSRTSSARSRGCTTGRPTPTVESSPMRTPWAASSTGQAACSR